MAPLRAGVGTSGEKSTEKVAGRSQGQFPHASLHDYTVWQYNHIFSPKSRSFFHFYGLIHLWFVFYLNCRKINLDLLLRVSIFILIKIGKFYHFKNPFRMGWDSFRFLCSGGKMHTYSVLPDQEKQELVSKILISKMIGGQVRQWCNPVSRGGTSMKERWKKVWYRVVFGLVVFLPLVFTLQS